MHVLTTTPHSPQVLCFSNGRDWARGLRSCLRHAEVGGVSMLLDS